MQCFPFEIDVVFLNRGEVDYNDLIVAVTTAKAFNFNFRIGEREETRTVMWRVIILQDQASEIQTNFLKVTLR